MEETVEKQRQAKSEKKIKKVSSLGPFQRKVEILYNVSIVKLNELTTSMLQYLNRKLTVHILSPLSGTTTREHFTLAF